MIERVTFIGSKPFGLHYLQAIAPLSHYAITTIITLDDRDDTRSVFDGFVGYASERRLPLFIPGDAKTARQMIVDSRPELCIVNGWYWLFDDELLKLPRAGFVGIHNSLLPRYRGGSPLVWSIIAGDDVVGSSTFFLSTGIDDGDIVDQVKVNVTDDDDVGTLLRKIESLTLDRVPKYWPALISESANRIPQRGSDVSYCAQRTPEDGLIDWGRPARVLFNFIRAQAPPYPGAYCMVDGVRVVITKSRVFPHDLFGTPGQIVRVIKDTGEVIVACGANTAIVVEGTLLDGIYEKPSKIFSSTRSRLTPTGASWRHRQ